LLEAGTDGKRVRVLYLCLGPLRREIGDAIEKNGDLTPAYWQAVRAMAIRYWLEMDRARIFEEIPSGEGG